MKNKRRSSPLQTSLAHCCCGCGEKTNLIRETVSKLGLIKDQPRKYKIGHVGRLKHPGWRLNLFNGCWEWQGYVTKLGYPGMISCNGKNVGAHVAYFLKKGGEIPFGYQLDHLCNNKKCVRPEHLRAVTPAENTRRRSSMKLNKEKVLEIKKLLNKGFSHPEIAQLFKISRPHITNISLGERWGDV